MLVLLSVETFELSDLKIVLRALWMDGLARSTGMIMAGWLNTLRSIDESRWSAPCSNREDWDWVRIVDFEDCREWRCRLFGTEEHRGLNGFPWNGANAPYEVIGLVCSMAQLFNVDCSYRTSTRLLSRMTHKHYPNIHDDRAERWIATSRFQQTVVSSITVWSESATCSYGLSTVWWIIGSSWEFSMTIFHSS